MIINIFKIGDFSMMKSILFFCISFIFTLLYVFVINTELIIFPFLSKMYKRTQDGGVWSNQERGIQIILLVILTIILVILIIFQFEKIRGYFILIYISSLLASFLMPLFFGSLNSGGFVSFPWYFTGIITVLKNVIFGPAMFFLITYLICKKING